MIKMVFKLCVLAFMLGMLANRPSLAQANEYPAKPIRLVLTLPPGGAAEILARTLGARLSESWGKPVVIDPRPGASGLIASNIVAKAAPDGYTLLLTLTNDVIAANVMKNVPYDIVRDFTPVARLAVSGFLLVVNPSVPVKTVPELLALARAKPGTLTYGTAGEGSLSHLGGAMLEQKAGIKLLHVPYKGAAESVNDTIAGHVGMTFINTVNGMTFVRGGKLRALAVTVPNRLELVPDIPTLAEAGLPDFEMSAWFGIKGPAGMPPEIVRKLSDELLRIVAQPAFREQLKAFGAEPAPLGPEAFGAYYAAEVQRWAQVVKQAGVRPSE